MCVMLLVGWRQGKYWEESSDGGSLRSFVSHYNVLGVHVHVHAPHVTCHMSHVTG